MYALTIALNDPSRTKIVPVSELYVLKAEGQALKFKPKKESSFSKNTEYGRILAVQGREMMVRHIIFALGGRTEDLKALYENEKKRFVAPKRQSMSPVEEPVDSYTFPEEQKDLKKIKKKVKDGASKSRLSEGDEILNAFKRKHDTEISSASKQEDIQPIGVPGSSFNSPIKKKSKKSSKREKNEKPVTAVERLFSDETSESRKSGVIDLTHDKPEVIGKHDKNKEVPSDNKENSVSIDASAGVLTPVTLTSVAEAVINEEKLKRRSEPWCKDSEHQLLQKKLDETMTELEHANRTIGTLKDQNAALMDMTSVKEELQNIKELLTKGKGSKISEPASNLHTLPSNLLDSDDEEVPEDKVKVDVDKYIERNKIISIERKVSCKDPRIDKLCNLFFDNKVEEYSFTGWTAKGKGIKKITNKEMESMQKILKTMKWSYSVDLDMKSIRSRVSHLTCSKRHENSEDAVTKKVKAAGKRRGTKPPPKNKEADIEMPSTSTIKVEPISCESASDKEDDSASEIEEDEDEHPANTSITLSD